MKTGNLFLNFQLPSSFSRSSHCVKAGALLVEKISSFLRLLTSNLQMLLHSDIDNVKRFKNSWTKLPHNSRTSIKCLSIPLLRLTWYWWYWVYELALRWSVLFRYCFLWQLCPTAFKRIKRLWRSKSYTFEEKNFLRLYSIRKISSTEHETALNKFSIRDGFEEFLVDDEVPVVGHVLAAVFVEKLLQLAHV